MKKRKIFNKMFITISTLIFVITLGVSTLFLIKNNQSENEKANVISEKLVDQIREKIDNKLAITNNIIYNISTNDNIKSYARDIGNYYFNTIQVKRELTNYSVSSSNLDYEIAITRKGDELFVTALQTYSLSDYYDYLGVSDDSSTLKKFIQEGYQDSITIESVLKDSQNTSVIIYARQVRVFPNDKIIVLLVFYKDKLFPDFGDSSTENLAILAEDNIYATGDNKDIFLNNINSKILNEYLSDNKFTSVTVSDSGQKHIIYFTKSEVLKDWYYIRSVPYKGIFENLVGLIKYYVMVWILFLFAGTLISYITIERARRPIKNAVEQLKKYKDNIEKKDELNYIVETVNEINNLNEELNKTINRNKDILKTKFLRDLSKGLLSTDEIREKSDIYELSAYKGKWTICVIDFSQNINVDDIVSRDSYIQIKAQIVQFLSKQLNSNISNEVLEYDQTRYLLVLQEADIKKVKSELNDILSIIEMSFDIRLTAAVSNPLNSLDEIYEAVMNTVSILDVLPAFDKRMIVTLNDIDLYRNNSNYYYPLDIEQTLLNIHRKAIEIKLLQF